MTDEEKIKKIKELMASYKKEVNEITKRTSYAGGYRERVIDSGYAASEHLDRINLVLDE